MIFISVLFGQLFTKHILHCTLNHVMTQNILLSKNQTQKHRSLTTIQTPSTVLFFLVDLEYILDSHHHLKHFAYFLACVSFPKYYLLHSQPKPQRWQSIVTSTFFPSLLSYRWCQPIHNLGHTPSFTLFFPPKYHWEKANN